MKTAGSVVLLALLIAGCAFAASRFDPPSNPPRPPETMMWQESYFEAGEVVPPNKSAAGGSFYGRLEFESREWTWEMTIARLDSPVTSVAVHGPAAKGKNGPLLFNMPIPPLEETIHGTKRLTQSQADDMRAGKLYLLVSTQRYPQGEIRAQISLRRPGERGAH